MYNGFLGVLLGKLNGIIVVKSGQNIFHSSCVAHRLSESKDGGRNVD